MDMISRLGNQRGILRAIEGVIAMPTPVEQPPNKVCSGLLETRRAEGQVLNPPTGNVNHLVVIKSFMP